MGTDQFAFSCCKDNGFSFRYRAILTHRFSEHCGMLQIMVYNVVGVIRPPSRLTNLHVPIKTRLAIAPNSVVLDPSAITQLNINIFQCDQVDCLSKPCLCAFEVSKIIKGLRLKLG